MKKCLALIVCIGLAAMMGCGVEQKPEDAAKNYVNENMSFHKNTHMDVTGLEYTVKESDESSAVVQVAGTIRYNQTLYLSKENGDWVVGDKPLKKAAPAPEPKETKKDAVEKPEPKKSTH